MDISYVKNTDELTNSAVVTALEKLEQLKNKPVSPEYTEMMSKYAASLDEIHADARCSPWEWGFGLDYLVEFIRFMRDYYALGENVHTMERVEEDPKRYKNKPTRLQTLEKTLYYYDKWQGLEDEYIKIVEHPETYSETDNGDGTVTINNLGFHCEYKYGSMKRTYKKLAKAQNKYKKLFYKMLYTYMEEWWD